MIQFLQMVVLTVVIQHESLGRLNVLYCVDLEVWSKLAECVRIMRIASTCTCDFDCDCQHKRVLPLHLYSDTRSTFANYLLLRYKSTGSCCYGM